MEKEKLLQSLNNLNLVIMNYKITKEESPLTGKEFLQLFTDIQNLNTSIVELDKLQKELK